MVKGFKHSECLCKFLADVECPYRRTVEQRKGFSVNAFCIDRCEHYFRFIREMDAEDERVMDGIDRLHELRERFERGEISEGEFRRFYDIINREMDGEVV